jgi:hypothetical protein
MTDGRRQLAENLADGPFYDKDHSGWSEWYSIRLIVFFGGNLVFRLRFRSQCATIMSTHTLAVFRGFVCLF